MTEQQRKAILKCVEELENRLLDKQARKKQFFQENPDVVDFLAGGFSLVSGACLVGLFVDD